MLGVRGQYRNIIVYEDALNETVYLTFTTALNAASTSLRSSHLLTFNPSTGVFPVLLATDLQCVTLAVSTTSSFGGLLSGTTATFTGAVGALSFSGIGTALTALTAAQITVGTIANSQLTNSAITIGNVSVSLGGTVTTITGLTALTATTLTCTTFNASGLSTCGTAKYSGNVGVGGSSTNAFPIDMGAISAVQKLALFNNGSVFYGLGVGNNCVTISAGATPGSTTIGGFVFTSNNQLGVNTGLNQADIGYQLYVVGTGRITGAMTLNSTLNVTGTTTVNNLHVTGTYTADLPVNTLSVTNSGTFGTYVSVGTTLTVGGITTLNDNVSITGAKTLTVGGATTLGSTLGVTGVITTNTGADTIKVDPGGYIYRTYSSTLGCGIVFGNNAWYGATYAGALAASGVTDIGTASVRMGKIWTTLLNCSSTVDFLAGLNVAGTSALGVVTSGNQTITGTLSVSSTLNVSQTTTLAVVNSGNHVITGTLNVSSTLDVSGTSTVAALTSTTAITSPTYAVNYSTVPAFTTSQIGYNNIVNSFSTFTGSTPATIATLTGVPKGCLMISFMSNWSTSSTANSGNVCYRLEIQTSGGSNVLYYGNWMRNYNVIDYVASDNLAGTWTYNNNTASAKILLQAWTTGAGTMTPDGGSYLQVTKIA